MDPATITRVVSDAQHANSLPEIKRAMENLALVVAMLSAELRDLKPNPKASTAAAVLAFQENKKNRVRR